MILAESDVYWRKDDDELRFALQDILDKRRPSQSIGVIPYNLYRKAQWKLANSPFFC